MQNKSAIIDEYPPSEDTFFIADYLVHEMGESALDVGSGSGYLTKLLTEKFSFVLGTDINFSVLKDQTYPTENLICCSGADAIHHSFDLIVCNLPYLATNEILDISTDGGFEGFEIPRQIFDSIYDKLKPQGKFIFVTSSLSNFQKLIDYSEKLGLHSHIIARKKLFFEELILIESIRK